MVEILLPGDFSALLPFAPAWCLATESERYAQRLASSMAEMHAFYNAIVPLAGPAIAYCDRFPLDALPEDAANLLHLLYSMVMVSFPVEAWGQPRIPDTGAAYLDLVNEPAP